jgi:hypothetical protein
MRTSGIMTREKNGFCQPFNESAAFNPRQGPRHLMQLIRPRFIALYQVTTMPIVLFIGVASRPQCRCEDHDAFGENLMTARLDIKSKTTRRRLLQGVAGVVSFFGLGATALRSQGIARLRGLPQFAKRRSKLRQLQIVHLSERLQVGLWRDQRERLVPNLEGIIPWRQSVPSRVKSVRH